MRIWATQCIFSPSADVTWIYVPRSPDIMQMAAVQMPLFFFFQAQPSTSSSTTINCTFTCPLTPPKPPQVRHHDNPPAPRHPTERVPASPRRRPASTAANQRVRSILVRLQPGLLPPKRAGATARVRAAVAADALRGLGGWRGALRRVGQGARFTGPVSLFCLHYNRN